jgi:homoserine dehydrogenase
MGTESRGPRPLVFVGYGQVARALAARLVGRTEFRVAAVVRSRAIWASEAGCDPGELEALQDGTPGWRPRLGSALEIPELLDRLPPRGLLIETTPVDPVRGEPARTHIEAALTRGWDVVTANKGPIALHGPELARLADRSDATLRFGATVGGGVPVLETIRGLRSGTSIQRIEAIVNGTTQFVLGRLAAGGAWTGALDDARTEGLAETDPSLDLAGVDAALKAAILHAAAFGTPLEIASIPRAAVEPSSLSRIQAAAQRGARLVARTTVESGSASVALVEVPRGDPWDVPGATNVFRIETTHAGVLWLSGPGAGPSATASALLSDVSALGIERALDRRSSARLAPIPAGTPRGAAEEEVAFAR